MNKKIQELIEACGSAQILTSELGYKSSAIVSRWLHGERAIADVAVPALMKVARKYKVKQRPYDYRPDLYAKTDKGA